MFEAAATAQIEAWNSHDVDAIRSVYTEDVGQLAEGQDEIEGYATEWFDWYPDVSVELVQPIAEASHEEPELGGVFSIRTDGDDDSCEVLMAVLLETDEDQEIVAERVYYDADLLIACGWLPGLGQAQTTPKASMASATLTKPAMLAPRT